MTNTADGKTQTPPQGESAVDASSPHDGLFYRTFSNRDNAMAFLKDVLPRRIVDRMAWQDFQLCSLKFVDAKLRGKYADLLYSARIGERRAFVYFLIDHKSSAERWTALQLLEYQTRLWRTFLDEPENRKVSKLPIIIPIVLHHGESGWRTVKRFREYYDLEPDDAADLAPYMLDFGMLVDDIGKATSEAILARSLPPQARVILFALRFGRTPEKFFEELPKLVPLLRTMLGDPHLELVVAGLIVSLSTAGKIRESEVRRAMQDSLGDSIAEEIIFGPERRYQQYLDAMEEKRTLTERTKMLEEQLAERTKMLEEQLAERTRMLEEQLAEQTRAQAEQLAQAQRAAAAAAAAAEREAQRAAAAAEQASQRATLTKQLTRKFGPLSASAKTRIDEATSAQLDAMTLFILDAKSIDEVLDELQNGSSS